MSARTQPRAPGLVAAGLLALGLVAACSDEVVVIPVEPKLTLSPESLDFGDVVVGLSARLELTLENSGNAVLSIGSSGASAELGAEFKLEGVPAELAEGAEARVLVTFVPSSVGARMGSIFFDTNARMNSRVEVPVKGRGVDPALVANPSVVDFGRVLVGQTRTASVIIENTGADPVEVVRLAPDASTSAEFSGALVRQVLPAGQRLVATLRYTPTGVGADAGKIVVIDNSRRPESLAVQVRGTGVDSDIDVEPQALDFNGLVVGGAQTQPFYVRNIGDREHRISALSFVSTGTAGATEWALSAPALPIVLAPGAGQQVDVTYRPRNAGADRDQVKVESTGLAAPVLVQLTGAAAEAPRPEIAVQPLQVDFGQVEVGQTLSVSVRIDSVGTAPLVLSMLELTPAGGVYSTQMAPAAGDSLPPGSSHTLRLVFSPTQVGPGPAGELVVRSNAATSPALRIPIVGESVNRQVPIVEVTPNPVDFGLVPRGTAAQRALTVRNVGTAPLTVQDVRLVDSQMGRFTVTMSIPQNSVLAAGQQLVATIQYLDQGVVATYVGQVEVRTSDPRTPVVNVSLTAVTDPPPVGSTDIAVTLNWNRTPADLDLHLIQPGGTLFDAPGDACFCNPNPDWAVQGQPTDNPFLDRDDVVGPGPENMNLSQAASGTYTVVIHYYGDINPAGTNDAEVAINLAGTRVATERRTLSYNQRWTVGTITWNAATRTGTWSRGLLPPFPALLTICY